MNKNRILVTGGAGFIGSHLVQRLLDENKEVVVLDNCCVGNKLCPKTLSKIEFIDADVRNESAVLAAAADCSAIVHLAALVGVDEVIRQPLDTIEIEIIGSQNIGKAIRLHRIPKVIYASSSAVYKNTLNEKSNESDDLHLVNDYAVAKRMNELYFQALAAEKGISASSLRFFNIYGLRQDSRMVLPRFLEAALNDEPIEVFGDGRQTRDFTHVDDVMTAIHILLGRPSTSGIFNVARGKETSIVELAQIVKQVTNSKSKIQFLDFPKKRLDYKVNKRVGSTDKLLRATGFQPFISLEDGLKKFVHQLKENQNKELTISAGWQNK